MIILMIFLIILLGTTLAKNTCHITTIQLYTPKIESQNSTSPLEDQNDGIQVIDMDSIVTYEKDIDAVSGYIDTRGTWRPY